MLHLTRYSPFQNRKMVDAFTRSDFPQMIELLCLPVGNLGSRTMLQLGRRRRTVPLCPCMTSGERVVPGECKLLDDWIWAATLSSFHGGAVQVTDSSTISADFFGFRRALVAGNPGMPVMRSGGDIVSFW